jgi:hypothetical protein
MLDDTQEISLHPQPAPKGSPLYLLTGLILGVILGLAYAWVINPVIYERTLPSSLGDADKDVYRGMIAQVYEATGDFQRASLRLALLEDPDPVYALGAQAQRALAKGDESEAHALALLASAFQSRQTAQDASTTTPLPTLTPIQPTPGVPTHTLPVPTVTP